MANYYANISGAANIEVPFNPYRVYTGNGDYVRLELNCDNLRTDSTKGNAAVWYNGTSHWFSFEMYGEGWEYFNLGNTTYIGRYDYWSTNGFEETLVLEINNGAVSLTKGQQTSATTFSGYFNNANISFFPTTYGVNTRVNFYEWKAYGTNNTLLFDFVPDYDGTTKGLRDKVSGNFYAATDQTKIELIPLSIFEIAPTESAATYESGTTTITVNTDNDSTITWTASTNDSWLSLSTLTGAGDGSVTVTYAENQAYQDRTGTVTFTSSEGDVLSFTIEQENKPALVYDRPIYRSGNLVKKMYRSGELIYLRMEPVTPAPPVPDDSTIPLTFEVYSAGTIVWKKRGSSASTRTIEYKLNEGNWNNITASDTTGAIINVSVGDILQFRGNNRNYSETGSISRSCGFGGTAKYYAYGNIMSLIYGNDFIGQNTLLSGYTYVGLFSDSTGLTSHISHKIVLPATTLTNHCYGYMFQQCTGLTTAPELPATTLASECYGYMFKGCTSLTTAPELPATTLANWCYYNMFQSCSGLTTAPELPATTLASHCYADMFTGCKNLTTAPELPAKTLANWCYANMFYDSIKLNYIKCLATDISADSAIRFWVNNVASTGTFVKDPNTTWPTGSSGIPEGWTVLDAE